MRLILFVFVCLAFAFSCRAADTLQVERVEMQVLKVEAEDGDANEEAEEGKAEKHDAAVQADTVPAQPHSVLNGRRWEKITSSRLFQSTYVGVPLIVGGLIEKHQDVKFRRLRNDFFPTFHNTLDNYTQYLPVAVMIGLKSFGVESRSSWGRMVLSDALSAVLMTATIQSLKYSIHVTRPDGSNRKSFPSGHTATAFMTATMLSKEYGHVSPWVSVGAYSVATATGLMRMVNNKHWLSDVMVGAGIGIISTEMGYWVADLLCKDRGLHIRSGQSGPAPEYKRCPSFLGLYMGFNIPLSHYDLSETKSFEMSTGASIGLEGAYFFSPYVGIGGRCALSNLQYIDNGEEASENTFNFYACHAGAYFSLPLTARWRVGSKALFGSVFYPANYISDEFVSKNNGFSFGSGLSVDYQVKNLLSAGAFLDYDLQAPHSRNSGEYLHLMTLGARVAVTF